MYFLISITDLKLSAKTNCSICTDIFTSMTFWKTQEVEQILVFISRLKWQCHPSAISSWIHTIYFPHRNTAHKRRSRHTIIRKHPLHQSCQQHTHQSDTAHFCVKSTGMITLNTREISALQVHTQKQWQTIKLICNLHGSVEHPEFIKSMISITYAIFVRSTRQILIDRTEIDWVRLQKYAHACEVHNRSSTDKVWSSTVRTSGTHFKRAPRDVDCCSALVPNTCVQIILAVLNTRTPRFGNRNEKQITRIRMQHPKDSFINIDVLP